MTEDASCGMCQSTSQNLPKEIAEMLYEYRLDVKTVCNNGSAHKSVPAIHGAARKVLKTVCAMNTSSI